MTDTPITTMDEPFPCPFCGGTVLRTGGDDKIVGISCLRCEACGPNHYGKYEWNDRASPARSAEGLVTNEMIAAAWKAWHSRHGGKLGPGPAFVEAIKAALSAQPGTEAEAGEPVAWSYELATHKNLDGQYCEWVKRLTDYEPNVPESSIRNKRPLYATPVSLASRVQELEKALLVAEQHIVTLGGNPHPHDQNADQIQVAVLAVIRATLTAKEA